MKKVTALIAALCILFLSACTVSSPVYMSSGKYEITESMYEYWLSYYKTRFYGSFSSYGIFNGEYDGSVWDERPDGGESFGEQVSAYVDRIVKEMIVCAKIYDESGLSAEKDTKKLLSDTVDQFIDEAVKAAGSRPELNSILSAYGMNVNGLRRVYEYEAKALIVSDRYFGEGGEYEPTDDEKERYYLENYHRVKHILINDTFKYVLDDNGEPVMDIYTGKYKREDLTEEEKAEKKALAQSLLERAVNGEDFEALIAEYNEDSGMETFPEGYFVKADSMLDTKYLTAALTLPEGGVSLEETTYGLMIIKKYPPVPGIWRDETYSAFFTELTSYVTDVKKQEIFGKRFPEITVNGTIDFSSVPLMDERIVNNAQ